MKLKRRGDEEAGVPTPAGEDMTPENSGKKPVIVYILALFLVAFLLMTLSLLAHQRSNTEAIGQLQSSVATMQDIQIQQEKIIALQEQLSQAQEALDAAAEERESLVRQASTSQDQLKETQDALDALTALYTLQQLYLAGEYDACAVQLEAMESLGYPALLASAAGENITPPARRYQELKTAVEARADTD